MNFIAVRKIGYGISAILLASSAIAFSMWGLKPGLEFTGGSLAEYYATNVDASKVQLIMEAQKVEGTFVKTSRGFLLRTKEISSSTHETFKAAILKDVAGAEEVRFESIGPSIGAELRKKAIMAVVLTLLMIMVYVAWAFRKVSGRIEAWKYGVLVVLAGLHDAFIPVGVFSALGHFYGTEVGGAFLAAILTILGYSINDTIVVFDRIRENITKTEGTVEEVVNRSIKQTWARSVNTTVTTLLALITVYFFGGESTKDFALALIVGIACGAYSSIFFASPLLVDWKKK